MLVWLKHICVFLVHVFHEAFYFQTLLKVVPGYRVLFYFQTLLKVVPGYRVLSAEI
jgi:hypothetical protein